MFPAKDWVNIEVTVSAYNSREGKTSITSWGDTLKPGMKVIAVSPDLLKLGLGYCTEVKIEGLPGTYVVMDKMHPRWEKKIDIYMGTNRKKALEWGRKKLEISYLSSSRE
ncbi:MAG TPA: 3D domain-containing protein [Salinimicrobium sp.]|nr:3D domain-containing protein [Salinimicrobium sp.]